MRARRSSFSSPDGHTSGWSPGELVTRYATMRGWTLAGANVFLEGTTDVAYFEIADRIYRDKTGLTLLDDEFNVIAIGEGADGGCENVEERFKTLRELQRTDVCSQGGRPLKIICEFDSDYRGKCAVSRLTSSRLGFVLYRDVFLLQRVLPRTTRAPQEFASLVKNENAPWKALDCEVEDLIARGILESFCSETPNALEKAPDILGTAHHFPFRRHVKGAFVKYVRDHAIYEDVVGLIEHLKCLRYALGCDPDGSSASGESEPHHHNPPPGKGRE